MIHERRTKIVATLGPSSSSPEMLEKMMIAGVDVLRCNFSHGSHEDHAQRIKTIRDLSKKLNREVAILADLQGPKIRIARFEDKKVNLDKGAEFILDAELDLNSGNEKMVGIDYKELVNDVKPDDLLLLDDGRVVLSINKIEGAKIFCTVVVGGELSNNKGINRQGGGLSAEALTDKDKADLKFAATLDVDYFAISFVRSADDLNYARSLIREAGSDASIIAKVERAEAVEKETLEEIIQAADAIMVARGDLGVEIGDAQLPAIQKHMIQRARALNKPVITATQMMETMIHNKIPTRAEVFDVANAVLDMTDAVMLSAESASGDHPDLVIETMGRICLGAEKNPSTQKSGHRIECTFKEVDEAIAMATMYTANHMDISAIISFTETGSTPLLMSRIKTGIPIVALTRNLATQRKMNLYRGVHPLPFELINAPIKEINHRAIEELKQHGLAEKDDLVILTQGDIMGEHGHTNNMKIIKVD